MLPIMKRSIPLAGAAACVSLALGACGGSDEATESALVSASPTLAASVSSPTTPATATAVEPIPSPVVAVMQAAAREAGVPIEEVALRSYRRVEWTSSALGCPESGKGYAQVITPGYAVRLSVGGEQVEYHTDMRDNSVRCADE